MDALALTVPSAARVAGPSAAGPREGAVCDRAARSLTLFAGTVDGHAEHQLKQPAGLLGTGRLSCGRQTDTSDTDTDHTAQGLSSTGRLSCGRQTDTPDTDTGPQQHWPPLLRQTDRHVRHRHRPHGTGPQQHWPPLLWHSYTEADRHAFGRPGS